MSIPYWRMFCVKNWKETNPKINYHSVNDAKASYTPSHCSFPMNSKILIYLQAGHIFPLLDNATPATVQTRSNNIKFILPHCNKDFFEHSFQPVALRGWNALPQSAVEATSLELFKGGRPPKCYILMSHWTGFFFCTEWLFLFCLLNAHFPYYFSFSGTITSHRQCG